jgi:hypothetical protein
MLQVVRLANVLYKTYTISCPGEPREAVERIEHLLSQEGVETITRGMRITSTRVPIIVLGLQRPL